MTKEEFMVIYNSYFNKIRSGKLSTNKRAIFCAYCAYKREVRDNGYIPQIKWCRKNNVPDFGYKRAAFSAFTAGQYFYNAISALCKGENFLDLVPDWREEVGNTYPTQQKADNTKIESLLNEINVRLSDITVVLSSLLSVTKEVWQHD